MDQIRKFVAAIGRLHFWLLCLLVAMVALVGWKLASAALTAQFDENKKKVTDHFGSLRNVTNDPKHPNEKINEVFTARADQQKKLVAERWKTLYDAQRDTVLRWPSDLGPFFSEEIYHKKFGDPIPVDDLARYQNQVQELFQKKFPLIVKASSESLIRSRAGGVEGWQAPVPIRRGDGPGNDGNPVVDDYVLHWDDYGDIVQKLNWGARPTPIKIWITQEDLWVYETLLNIIARTNAGAKGPHDAVVKRIVQLQVGQDAALESNANNRIYLPPQAAGGEGAARPEESEAKLPGRRESESGEVDAEARDKLLLENRYLDEKGQPLDGDSVLPRPDAAGGNPKPFNRLPVRMVLEMDVRRLEQVLVECANAELPVEVHEVRINVDQSGAGDRGGFPGRSSAGGKSESSGGRLGFQSARRGIVAQASDPAVVPVIVQGTIYIYNPPNLEALGLTASEQP